jgi:hypothetical protein
MACDLTSLSGYLKDFTGLRPIEAVICPYAQSPGGGLGLGIPVFALVVLSPLMLGLAARVQHPGPVLVAMILLAGTFAAVLPGPAAQLGAIALFFGIISVGFIMYRRASNTLSAP